jgi:hypothetical protein
MQADSVIIHRGSAIPLGARSQASTDYWLRCIDRLQQTQATTAEDASKEDESRTAYVSTEMFSFQEQDVLCERFHGSSLMFWSSWLRH